jgi:hypothetical protein
VDAIARAQLAEVEQRLDRLASLKRELERMIEQCSGGRIPDCRVIEALGEPGPGLADDAPAGPAPWARR